MIFLKEPYSAAKLAAIGACMGGAWCGVGMRQAGCVRCGGGLGCCCEPVDASLAPPTPTHTNA
jgi:hypothetical protein